MKQIWAPWRLQYVQHERGDGCFLCREFEAGDDRENLVLKRGRHCAVVMNRYPYTNGHLLVCPYRHIPDVTDMTDEEHLESMQLVSAAIGALRSVVHPHGFNVGTNVGEAAGAGLVGHIHTHVVPRWEGDTNFITVLDDVRIVPQALKDLWDALHPLLND